MIAELNEDEGIYYVTGHTPNESEATHFIPVETEDSKDWFRSYNCSMDNLCADEANFRTCSFDGCSLQGAKMLHCNLTQAEFRDTSMDGADLRWSCVDGIHVEENVLEQANTKNVSFSECAQIPIDLHDKVREEKDALGLALSEYVTKFSRNILKEEQKP